jgi:hypothetical protein
MGSTQQYNNNYQVWAGACEQEQPLQPPTVGSTPTDFATITPGKGATPSSVQAVDAIVFEPAIDVAVQFNGSPVTPSQFDILFSGNNSAGTLTCKDNWKQVQPVGTDTVSGVAYNTYPAPFASQAAKGSASASNTGDTGTIQVCAAYNGYSLVSSAFTTTNFTGPTMVPVMDVRKNGTKTACPW